MSPMPSIPTLTSNFPGNPPGIPHVIAVEFTDKTLILQTFPVLLAKYTVTALMLLPNPVPVIVITAFKTGDAD